MLMFLLLEQRLCRIYVVKAESMKKEAIAVAPFSIICLISAFSRELAFS